MKVTVLYVCILIVFAIKQLFKIHTLHGVPNGDVKLGSFVPDEVSKAELARRKKWSRA